MMAVVEEKHARWQAELRGMLSECACNVTQQMLYPATYLDSLQTALHLTTLLPHQLRVMKPSLRKVVQRFQRRAAQLGVMEKLPKLMYARQMRMYTHQVGPPPPAWQYQQEPTAACMHAW